MEKEIFKVVNREVSSNIGDNIKLILQYAKDEKALFTMNAKEFSISTKVFINQIEIIFKPFVGGEFSICFSNNEKNGFLYIQDKEKISFKKMKFKTNHSKVNKNKYWYVNIFDDEAEKSINNRFETFLLEDYDKNMDNLNDKVENIFKIINLLTNKEINEKIESFIKNINLENKKDYIALIEKNKDNLKDFLTIHDKVVELGFCPYNLNKEDKEIILLQTDDNLEKLKIEKNIFKNVVNKFFKK